MSAIADMLRGGANNPTINYGNQPTNPMIEMLRKQQEERNALTPKVNALTPKVNGPGAQVGPPLQNEGLDPTSDPGVSTGTGGSVGTGGISMGDLGKGLGKASTGLGMVGQQGLSGLTGGLSNALGIAEGLRDFGESTTRQKLGTMSNLMGAATPLAPPLGMLSGAMKLGLGAYDSLTEGWLGDAFGIRDDEDALDSLEDFGYSRDEARDIMGIKAPETMESYQGRTGGRNGGNGSGGDRDHDSMGGMGGASDRDSSPGGMGGV